MAWRIHSQIIRGEIDNRIRNVVTGLFWVVGRHDPIQIRLSGNAARDLAGRRLEIFNPTPRSGLRPAFASEQFGFVGEFTASRRVRVQHGIVQVEGASAPTAAVRWLWTNSVYFEWFSEANGHIIIDSANFLLKVDPDTTWDMSATEEVVQRAHTSQMTRRFLNRLGFSNESENALDLPRQEFEVGKDAEETEDEFGENFSSAPSPMTEEEADALMDDSDRLAERLMRRLEAAGPDADIEAILAEELELRRNEENQIPFGTDKDDDSGESRKEMRARAEEILRDPNFRKIVRQRHPLADRARNLALEIMGELDHLSWTSGYVEKSSAILLATAISKAGGKIAGALDGKVWPPCVGDTALCIAWLKRAQRYFEEASAAAAVCADQAIFMPERLSSFRGNIFSLKTETANLIDELRERLSRGFE